MFVCFKSRCGLKIFRVNIKTRLNSRRFRNKKFLCLSISACVIRDTKLPFDL